MATCDISFGSICVGGGHLMLNVAVNGGPQKQVHLHTLEFQDPPDGETIAAAVLGLLRLYKIGKSVAQVKSDLQSGITLTVG